MTMLILTAISCYAADGVQIWSPAQMKAQSTVEGNQLGSYGTHSAALWKRTKSGVAELHKTKADLLIIQDGAATFISGGTIVNAHPTTAGEVRGASIANGQSRKLSPGDVIHVSPNTPHQFLLEPGQSISYLAIKIAR